MRMRLFLSMGLWAALTVSGCAGTPFAARYLPRPDGHYDNHTYLVDSGPRPLTRVASSIVTLITRTRFAAPGDGTILRTIEGSGVVLGGKYVLTVEHNVVQRGLKMKTPMGVLDLPVVKMKEDTFIRWEGKLHLLRPVYKNYEDDIAFFELPLDVHPPSFPYTLGNSSELRVGNFVYVVGNPLNLGINVREGIVSATRAPRQISQIHAKGENAFMISNGLVPGDSGTPVIAIRDGRFELVGISQGTFVGNNRLGWVIRINVIKTLLKLDASFPGKRWVARLRKGTLPVSYVSSRKSEGMYP